MFKWVKMKIDIITCCAHQRLPALHNRGHWALRSARVRTHTLHVLGGEGGLGADVERGWGDGNCREGQMSGGAIAVALILLIVALQQSILCCIMRAYYA